MAEDLALKLGVEYANDRSFRKIILETDSRIVYDELVKNKEHHRWKLKPFIVRIDRMIKELPQVRIN